MTKPGILDRRLRWFEEGAAALQRTRPGHVGVYGCPLCLGTFGREAVEQHVLTDEHIPPKAVGGQIRLLTCRKCNGHSASRYDAHLATAHRLLTWGTPDAVGPLPATIMLDGISNRGEISFDGTTLHHLGVQQRNDQRDIERLNEVLPRIADGHELQLHISARVDFAAAALSLLRTAYLAAFITFGYRYILQPPLDRVRRAIALDDRDVVPVMHREGGSIGDRMIVPAIVDPEWARGAVAVVVDRALVFLPGLGIGPDVFETHASVVETGRQAGTLHGHEWLDTWPTEPSYYCDVEPVNPAAH